MHLLSFFYTKVTLSCDALQGDVMIIANVGDSRAVMAVTSSDGNLEPVQLTKDLKPNLPGKLCPSRCVVDL